MAFYAINRADAALLAEVQKPSPNKRVTKLSTATIRGNK